MKNLFSNIKGDAFGGITAGIVALPLALAFGVSSGLGPSAGLYGAKFVSFFAALFGGTSTQISGPTAPRGSNRYDWERSQNRSKHAGRSRVDQLSAQSA